MDQNLNQENEMEVNANIFSENLEDDIEVESMARFPDDEDLEFPMLNSNTDEVLE